MATTSATATSLSLRTPRFSFFSKPASLLSLPTSKPYILSLSTKVSPSKDDIDTTFFDEADQEEEFIFDPPEKPEGFVPPRAIDEPPFESEEEIGKAYEELYGPAYSAESYLGNDVCVMDSKINAASKIKKEKVRDGLEEILVEVRRVTKVVKGGKNLNFRALVLVGDKKGQVGVGVGKATEISGAVEKAAADARRNLVTVPMTKYLTFPHRAEAKYGAAKVMLRPAASGSGVIAGGVVRRVLEMAGVENALGKQLGSDNAINNARATVRAIQSMRLFSEVAAERGIPMEELWK